MRTIDQTSWMRPLGQYLWDALLDKLYGTHPSGRTLSYEAFRKRLLGRDLLDETRIRRPLGETSWRDLLDKTHRTKPLGRRPGREGLDENY